MSSNILVTGAAGFIGFHLSKRLCELDYNVSGIDNLNSYYDVELKRSRLDTLKKFSKFRFEQIDLTNQRGIESVFGGGDFKYVVNLAAQAGVRYSIENPGAYVDSNIRGFLNILEACRHHSVKHLVYASSSSVYGANRKLPFDAANSVDHPLSLYAASKKANELMAHTYSNLYHLPTTGLRFFTAYGPFGRPDMALFIFTKAILEGKPIDVFNFGRMKRDFTYIDDLVSAIVKVMPQPPEGNKSWNGLQPDPSSSFAPYRIFNVGNNTPVELLTFIEVLEEKLGRKAIKNFLPLQEGDVEETFADMAALEKATGFVSSTPIQVGIENFVNWYREYYKVKKAS